MMSFPERTGVPDAAGIAVYCGAREEVDPLWLTTAHSVGQEISSRGLRIVYGGGGRGLMGHLANGAVSKDGYVTGVIPASMIEKEAAHPGIADQRVVQTMHERKALITALSDGFLALPGGVGTLDELLEAITWRQLGIHQHRIAILNTGGFYDELWSMLKAMNRRAFVPQETLDHIRCSENASELLDWLTHR